MIVHSHQAEKKNKNAQVVDDTRVSYSEDDKIFVNPRFSVGLADPNAGPKSFVDHQNPCGFCVRATKNGSMTQESFFDFCVHFVKNRRAQNDTDLPHILFLDGHASRWNLAALRYLMANKVYPFFLPSHTSVWTQPNDNGPNIRFHKCVEDAIKRLRSSGAKNTVSFYNMVLRHSWLDFIQREREELLNAGCNCTTNCWEKTGFFPFDPNPESWRHVLSTLGKLNEEMKKGEKNKNDEFEIKIKDGIAPDDVLTDDDKRLLMEGIGTTKSTPIEAAYYHMRALFARWREEGLSLSLPEGNCGDSVSTITTNTENTQQMTRSKEQAVVPLTVAVAPSLPAVVEPPAPSPTTVLTPPPLAVPPSSSAAAAPTSAAAAPTSAAASSSAAAALSSAAAAPSSAAASPTLKASNR